eukprot:11948676-Alexandrium_andersonii.AAC.1
MASSQSSASWEGWDGSWVELEGPRWEEEGPEGDEEIDWAAVTPEMATEEFPAMLVRLKLQGTLSARQVCTLCFWASRAGLGGLTKELAVRPNQQSGQYSRHFDKVVLEGACPETYDVFLARRQRHDPSR